MKVIDVSFDEEAEEKTMAHSVPVKDSKTLVSPVQDEVDWDLLEAEIEDEEAVAELEKREPSDNISIKDD